MPSVRILAKSTFIAIPNDIVTTTGPRILGYLFHWGLFGVLSVQVYLYYLAFPKDPLRCKLIVYSLFILEVIQTIMMTYSCFHVFGSAYGDMDEFDIIGLGWITTPLITGFVAFIAQTFYAFRIRVLSQSYWMAGVIMFLTCAQLGGAIATAHTLKQVHLFSHLRGKQDSITAGFWNGGSAVCDILISVCMTYLLSRPGKGTPTRRTQVYLRRIIRVVIETGLITAFVATLNITFLSLPTQPSYYLATSDILAKLYSNSTMAVLNSRMRISVESLETDPESDPDREPDSVGVKLQFT